MHTADEKRCSLKFTLLAYPKSSLSNPQCTCPCHGKSFFQQANMLFCHEISFLNGALGIFFQFFSLSFLQA